jgi:acyl-homoserine lactone acylase PvdQ
MALVLMPNSPHYADQTSLYSEKGWVKLPYCADEIAEAQIGEVLVLEE